MRKLLRVLGYVWHTKSFERLGEEFVFGVSVAYDRDEFDDRHLRVAFLAWGLYLEWWW